MWRTENYRLHRFRVPQPHPRPEPLLVKRLCCIRNCRIGLLMRLLSMSYFELQSTAIPWRQDGKGGKACSSLICGGSHLHPVFGDCSTLCRFTSPIFPTAAWRLRQMPQNTPTDNAPGFCEIPADIPGISSQFPSTVLRPPSSSPTSSMRPALRHRVQAHSRRTVFNPRMWSWQHPPALIRDRDGSQYGSSTPCLCTRISSQNEERNMHPVWFEIQTCIVPPLPKQPQPSPLPTGRGGWMPTAGFACGISSLELTYYQTV